MQIPIMSGVYTDNSPHVRSSYPVNLIPVPKNSGVSEGYLRPAWGIVAACPGACGPGIDRGGINWEGICYRVMGSKLVRVNANTTVDILGDVGGVGGDQVSLTYSFDRLAIASAGRLFYWSQSMGLVEVVDPDLGVVVDVRWIDGYFLITDGENLIVTELNDPTQINPIKYGSSEVDPDPIQAILKLRNEAWAINKNTIEVFDNVGGQYFPYQRIDGAHITKGTIGTHACCVFMDSIAFLGGGRNEPPGVYLGMNASASKISTAEIDQILQQFTEVQLSNVIVEAKADKSHEHLLIHLPDRTIVFDGGGSKQSGEFLWFVLTSSVVGFSEYRLKNFVWAYNKWLAADTQTASIGTISDTISSHWGNIVRWEFATTIIYNSSRGAIFHELELVALPGSAALGINPMITTSYSLDGRTWSQDKAIYAGSTGGTMKRLVWFQQGISRNMRMQRFRGDSQAHVSFLRLEAQIEPLVF